jgi:hypothetical protein
LRAWARRGPTIPAPIMRILGGWRAGADGPERSDGAGECKDSMEI